MLGITKTGSAKILAGGDPGNPAQGDARAYPGNRANKKRRPAICLAGYLIC